MSKISQVWVSNIKVIRKQLMQIENINSRKTRKKWNLSQVIR
jgi:hypothetical protein